MQKLSEILDIYEKTPKAAEILKSLKEGKMSIKISEPKSAIIDPYGTYNIQGLRAKPTPMPYATLRRMAQVPAIAAVINTRLNQVARFARRPRFEGDMGLKVVLKDKEKKMSEAQKKKAFEIEEFLLKTGAVPNAKRKDNFDSFLRKVTRDTLTIDAMAWENVKNLKGGLAEIWAVDSATIELVANAPLGEDHIVPVYVPITKRGQEDNGHIAYVQKIDGQIIAEYTEEELCYAIRNPRTDIYFTDFGMSELETLIEIVTGIVNGVRYNTSYFSESHLPQGVLEMVGRYEDEDLEAFKRHWKTMVDGASGKWAVPVMALSDGQGFKFTSFKNSNRDMEYNEFLEFLFNITCAVYQIDPNEVGFKSWTSGKSMTQSDNTEAKIAESQDKGFIPLMQFLANTVNSEVIDRIDEDYAFTWIGIDEEDEQKKLERDKMLVDMGKVTIAELRKRDDLEEILDEDGKPAKWTLAPANPTLIQVYMAGIQAEQAEEQQKQAQAQQAQDMENQDDQFNKEGANEQLNSEDEHRRQLEIMDKQHQQTIEQKQLDHKLAMEQKKADQEHQSKPSEDKKKPLKKSFEDDFEIGISWKDY